MLEFGDYIEIDSPDNPNRRDRAPRYGVVSEEARTKYGYGKAGTEWIPVNITHPRNGCGLNGVKEKFITPITQWQYEKRTRGWR